MSKNTPSKAELEESEDEQDRDDLRKLVMNSNTKKNFSVSDDADFESPPMDLSPTMKQMSTKPDLNPEFLFQPLDMQILEFPVHLPPKTCKRKFTMVVDLDETLVHYDKEKKAFFVRPYTRHFLRVLAVHYEIVLFTAAMKDYTDYIIEKVDTEKKIDYRLYREHTLSIGNANVKDLSRIGRDLAKTIIIDNNPHTFQLQPRNGIYIRTWISDPDDKALLRLSNVLVDMAQRDIPDVRMALQKLREKTMARFAIDGRLPAEVILSKEFRKQTDSYYSKDL